ncbi:MAG: TolC family protein [Gemmatimonadaceae bacterium]|nr:TolC family protein [Gemmatimonadaceae bacterium]
MLRVLSIAGALLLSAASPLAAQLSLADALRTAESSAYANRIATAEASAQAAGLAAYRGILPTLRVEAGYLATNDPINAFGTTLRQRAITPADFDPARLNYPDAARAKMAGLVLEQPLLNADAWTGRRAAGAAANASEAMAAWTRTATSTDVIRAYYGATLAAERRATLAAALRAADAHVARAQALADTGMVTRADALLARVRAGEVRSQLLEAENDAAMATRGLATLLGADALAAPLPDALPASAAILAQAAADSAANAGAAIRADVTAATAAATATSADAWRARSLYLPRLNGFARYDWNDADAWFANQRAWTVGVMATWTPFAGASEISEVRSTNARADAATARREAAVANAALELERSHGRLQVAIARLGIAEDAVAQSAEAHRIVARKYDGGLATISELLEAAATETQSRLMLTMARYQLIDATAQRRVALGTDPRTLVALDAAPTTDSNR